MSDGYGGSGYGQPDDGGQGPDDGQPQYGQPPYGQPQYGQPQHGQPQYGQPQYGQSQYGQPSYPSPHPGYDGGDGSGPRTWSTLAIVGAALCWIPCLGLVSIVLGIIALATLRGRRGMWLGIASIVVPIVISGALIAVSVIVFAPAERNAAGEITSAGTLDFAETRQGDCLDIDGLADSEISETGLRGVPCSETHNAQAFGVTDVSDAGETYPGERRLQSLGQQGCAADQNGINLPGGGYSPFYLYPTESVWDDDVDNRVVLCLVVKTDYSDFSGDLVN